jgi:diguanylate cyclase (GGDEF)-like protein
MAAQHRGVLRSVWLWYTVAGIGASAAYFLLPAAQNVIYLLIGFSAVVAIGIGRRIHASGQRGWRTLGVGIFLYGLGDLFYTVIATTTGTEPFPSLADGPYVLGQVLVVVGILRLAAPIERGLYRPASIDAALVATAGLFIAWPLVLDPMAIDGVEPFSAVVALSYPLLDIVLVGVLARHLLQPGPRTRSLILMLSGATVWLVADLAYAGLSASGEYVSGMWLDVGWLLGYLLIGAAALHPSMARVVSAGETHEATISNRRLVLLATILLVPVVAFAVHGPPLHAIDVPVFALGAIAVLVLGALRLLGSLHASRVILAEQRLLEAELDLRARTDRLTGLANRAALTDRLAAAVAQGERVGLVYLDLDDFKRINDAFGHPAGEGVLREVALRLLSIAAVAEDVAHVGGDEFAIIVRDCGTEAEATGVALRVMNALQTPVTVAGHRFRIQASIGIVWSGTEELNADEVLSRADIAMYQVKGRGGSGYAVFEPEMHARALLRTRLQNDLEGAVARGEIEPWFQPIYGLELRDLIAVEALARWTHPEHGLIPPDEFIPIAELSGAIGGVDRHIIRVAAGRVAAWNELGAGALQLHVNITPQEATDPATVEGIALALAESGLPPYLLVVEVTETALIDEAAVAPVLASLKALGVRLSIDDFGSRYAVLTQLGRLPIDIVKLDRSVLAGIGSAEGGRLFEGIIRLAQSLRLETIAEGVESMEVLPFLRRLGCTAAQGYALGRPMPAATFTDVVLESADRTAIA